MAQQKKMFEISLDLAADIDGSSMTDIISKRVEQVIDHEILQNLLAKKVVMTFDGKKVLVDG